MSAGWPSNYSEIGAGAQGGIVFNDARAMVKKSAALASHYGMEPGVLSIARAATHSAFKPLPGDPGDGTSPHCAIIDEYHEHDSPRAYRFSR